MHLNQHAGARHSGPRPKAQESGVDVSLADECLHRRIDPAVQRNVGAGQSAGTDRRRLLGNDLQVVVKILVVPLLVDLPSDLIAQQAADEDIGQEVLFGGGPRQADAQRQVRRRRIRATGIGILVRNDGGERPRHGGVAGRKRSRLRERRCSESWTEEAAHGR